MQIPSGTLRSRENGVALGSYLENLAAAQCTGYCAITLRGSTCLLVFGRGKCILAEYGKLSGDDAWGYVRRMKYEKVDAVLYDLTHEQVELTVNFNPAFQTAESLQETQHKAQHSTTVIKPVAAKGMPGRRVKVGTVSSGPATGSRHIPAGDAREEHHHRKTANVEGGSDRISVESLKGLKESFKADVATLLKDLDLAHLMVEVPEKENVKKTSQDTEREGC